MANPSQDVTLDLRAWARGDSAALDRVTPALYQELRRLAGHYLAGERPGHTLQPTALIGEAFARLIQEDARDWQSRGHFIAIAARCMRQILVEHARARRRHKRSTGERPVTFDDSLSYGNAKDGSVSNDNDWRAGSLLQGISQGLLTPPEGTARPGQLTPCVTSTHR